jgi:hypothetical protein
MSTAHQIATMAAMVATVAAATTKFDLHMDNGSSLAIGQAICRFG